MIKFNLPQIEPDETPAKIEKWYDRHTRSWVIQIKNKTNDQIGNAEYFGTKEGAENEYKRLKAAYNI
jgi:hypothetical protein